MNNIKIVGLALFIIIAAAGCRKEKSDFSGGDNYITSFQLKQGDMIFQAAISEGQIVLSAPEDFSLDNATATVVVSENARITPDPSGIQNWNEEHTFTVTSYNGTKQTYQYSVVRNVVAKDGDVVLLTQADVEALAALNVTQINGSLTIGAATGLDSVYSLASLSGLKTIQYGLTINATYAGDDLAGLENLETVGSLQIQQNKSLRTVELPKLAAVMSDLIINQSPVTIVRFPELTHIDKGLQILAGNNISEMEFPKLKNIVENLTLTGATTSLLTVISFPLLEKAGGNISISNWREATTLSMPLLSTTTAVNISGLAKLESLSMPALTSTGNNVTLSSLPLLTDLDLTSLQSTGGEFFLSSLSQLKNTQGIKSLQSVGGRLYLSGLTALDDAELSGLAQVNTVSGDITLSQVPFKKFLGFALSQVNSLSINGSNISSIEEINVSNLDVVNTLSVTNVSSVFTLKGKNNFTGSLTLQNSGPSVMEGFEEVNNLNYTMNQNTQPERAINIRKINGNATLSVYNFPTFRMPLLEEVAGAISLTTSDGISIIEFPVLKKAGSATLDVAILPAFELSALQTVEGNFSISTGKYRADNLAVLDMPSLHTVGGILSLSGYSTNYYNTKLTQLDGLSSLQNAGGITVSYNMGLTDFTGLKNVLPSLAPANWNVSNNNYNPTYQDMLDGKYVKP